MLKIKDDVDLKELEKFGFELILKDSTEYYRKRIDASYDDIYIKVQPISKKILIDTVRTYISELDILYDLIQAGLVEKVVE